MNADAVVVGGGLAGSEAAWQLAKRGVKVRLFEMRPDFSTGAHQTGYLAELVCSNSLGSKLPDRASGVLMAELRTLGSILLICAERNAVPAGGALAVDREHFARDVTEQIEKHPQIQVIRNEAKSIPEGFVIIASGPLTSDSLTQAIGGLSDQDHLFFFDALAPIIDADSINMEIAFRASRYERGDREEGDYINCPLNKEEYEAFIDGLLRAERIPLRSFEKEIEEGVRAGAHHYFEGCLPVEILAERGRDSLAFGPMRPVGLRDPRSGKRPHAVLQLRQDNLAGSLYNMVGFQTNLTYSEQQNVFRMIPGLENARFQRYGQMHRNTFLNAPMQLRSNLQHLGRSDLFFAGQLTGVEGYLGNIGTGLLAGINLSRLIKGEELLVLPRETMLGSLAHYIAHADTKLFQPMKANFGLMPPLDDGRKRNRRERASAYAERSAAVLAEFIENTQEQCA
ncbi:MAG: methylenetetrahydrofolate--tRNA-(uracil(54)-C(5))-methyltransferase (FADH(2)-oxidizing) TrmFO [Anaerolineales bacterium]|nr:MAG: methylenetetrahydrofolate--tRNA-(uracil(54)-C(5))-methyltransferase (FADH(2)-oxidizing) TrmFO [Anaerolineales bacterium]